MSLTFTMFSLMKSAFSHTVVVESVETVDVITVAGVVGLPVTEAVGFVAPVAGVVAALVPVCVTLGTGVDNVPCAEVVVPSASEVVAPAS